MELRVSNCEIAKISYENEDHITPNSNTLRKRLISSRLNELTKAPLISHKRD